MATWRTTAVQASAADNPTWRATRVAAESTPGPAWRGTRVAAEQAVGATVWRATRVAAEVFTSTVPPTANPGPPVALAPAELGQLDGSQSQAVGTTIASYLWRLVSKTAGAPTPVLSSTTAAQPTLRAPIYAAAATYTFGLKVTDAGGLQSAEATVTVSVLPSDMAFAVGTAWQPVGLLLATDTSWS